MKCLGSNPNRDITGDYFVPPEFPFCSCVRHSLGSKVMLKQPLCGNTVRSTDTQCTHTIGNNTTYSYGVRSTNGTNRQVMMRLCASDIYGVQSTLAAVSCFPAISRCPLKEAGHNNPTTSHHAFNIVVKIHIASLSLNCILHLQHSPTLPPHSRF